MGFSAPVDLPLIALPKDTVLLPEQPCRLFLSGWADPSIVLKLSSEAKSGGQLTLCCFPRIPRNETPTRSDADSPPPANLFKYGVIASVKSAENVQSVSNPSVLLSCTQRCRLESQSPSPTCPMATVSPYDDEKPDPADHHLQARFNRFREYASLVLTLKSLFYIQQGIDATRLLAVRYVFESASENGITETGSCVDYAASFLAHETGDKMKVLGCLDLGKRLDIMNEILDSTLSAMSARIGWSTKYPAATRLDLYRSASLRALRDMHKRLQSSSNRPPAIKTNGIPSSSGMQWGSERKLDELEELRSRITQTQFSPEAERVVAREMKRLEGLRPDSSEHAVCRTYLETLVDIPWIKASDVVVDSDTMAIARKQLNDDHYGLDKVKKRLLEYIAVLRLKQNANSGIETQIQELTEETKKLESVDQTGSSDQKDQKEALDRKLQDLRNRKAVDKSPILLLHGPPGVGKTSLAKSVATALGREFHRISLGGVRDEAEIRGHRRTYVAAMPGLIVSGLKKVEVCNPVFLLDEIDKLCNDSYHGDPSAAMLEVLDPEQNHTFTDHYVNIPVDLSRVLFIATANSLDNIPAPLLDRMETIQLSGYTTIEKRRIARQHLIPKQIKVNGLSDGQVELSDKVIDSIATAYTREAGVRNLEREIGSICRYKAVQYTQAQDSNSLSTYNPDISIDELEDILGIERFLLEIAEEVAQPGVVTGLVAFPMSGQGSILFIEVADMPGTGQVKLTGTLGDVLKESAEVALTWVKANAHKLGLTPDDKVDIMEFRNVHVHCPAGAIPKDGPSAGLAHTVALVSLFSGRSVPAHIAMTGEVSLRGRVMPVGGIKEKLIGAHRAGVKTVLLPVLNEKDLKDVPAEVKDDMDIVPVSGIWEALRLVWPEKFDEAAAQQVAVVESRL